jgi:Tol biopolymer transport system component
MKMSYLNHQKNHARQLLGLALATAVLTGLSVVTSYSATRSRSFGRVTTTGTAIPITQPQMPALKANGKIAFASELDGNQEIYTMNPDGSGLTRLTFEPEFDHSPAWSPDGTKILFSRNSNKIFVMNADGSNQRQLDYSRSATESDFGHAWSPDSTKIVFVRTDARNRRSIFVMNADGSDQRRLTEWRNYLSPGWSPDGTKIVFSLWYFPGNSIYVMDADGSNQRIIGSQNRYLQAAWSPDGSKLALAGNEGIYLMNVDGSNETRITQSSEIAMYFDPTWSPDGSRIAFTKWTDCDWNDCYTPHIFVVNVDGSNPVKLADNLSSGRHPWSPDSSKIVFTDGRDILVANPDGSGTAKITNTNKGAGTPSWQALSVTPPPPNPTDDAAFFIRQHYLDFLNREPDAAGFAFWADEVVSCGADQSCIAAKRINVSAAFFLSIEFQQTGYLVYRIYKAAYGDLPGTPVPVRLNELLPDTKQIGQSVIVGQPGWEQVLENNKQAFTSEFVQRSRFTSAFPMSLTSTEFVDQLFLNAGVTPSKTDRTEAINAFGGAHTSADNAARAHALQRVAENPALVQQEFNRAFVLMQYFGYLRRNPNDLPDSNFDGYYFWLNKLDQFNGNYINAEMVKAFIVSIEYRQRFGP